jgi:hypothetical protein
MLTQFMSSLLANPRNLTFPMDTARLVPNKCLVYPRTRRGNKGRGLEISARKLLLTTFKFTILSKSTEPRLFVLGLESQFSSAYIEQRTHQDYYRVVLCKRRTKEGMELISVPNSLGTVEAYKQAELMREDAIDSPFFFPKIVSLAFFPTAPAMLCPSPATCGWRALPHGSVPWSPCYLGELL